MNYEVLCMKANNRGSYDIIPNNFLRSLKFSAIEDIGLKVVLDLRHRHFDINAENASDSSQGLTLSYFENPFEKDENKRIEHVISIDIEGVDYDTYNMLCSRDKEQLEITFLRRDLKVSTLKYQQLLKD